MSTASRVPETHDLEGDDAVETLRETGVKGLVRDGFARFRYSDGFSHSRALAFQLILAAIPGLIVLVAVATVLGQQSLTDIVSQTLRDLAPGPASEFLTRTLEQGSTTAEENAETAVIVGGLAALVAGAGAMGQIERGANRIYGVERDRPALPKYVFATVLACTAGIATAISFVLLVPGRALGDALEEVTGWGPALDTLWTFGRWWLAFGSTLSVLLWFAFTGLLTVYLHFSEGFGETYGPLAGLIGLLIWGFLTALALYLGLAVAAQLEAIRAGEPGPTRDDLTAPERDAAPAFKDRGA